MSKPCRCCLHYMPRTFVRRFFPSALGWAMEEQGSGLWGSFGCAKD